MLTKRRWYMQGRPAMSVFLRYRFVLLAMAVVLAGAWPVARAFEGPLTVHIVNPQATDPAIDQALDNHYAWVDPTAPTNGQLFVYMPGTGDVPANALLVQQM